MNEYDSEKMLEIGRDRVLDSGLLNVKSLVADAEDLPFPDNSFDCISIAFGIRNVTNKDKALEEFIKQHVGKNESPLCGNTVFQKLDQ